MTRRLDCVAIGEVLVEFTRLDSTGFRCAWAGDVANTLFYATRLGLNVGLVTRFGSDLFTERITRDLRSENIDLSLSSVSESETNGLYFIEPVSVSESRFHYWRTDSAATKLFEVASMDDLFEYCASAKFVLMSGITLAIARERQFAEDLMRRLSDTDAAVVLDPNYRPALWSTVSEYRRTVGRLLRYVDILVPSQSDVEALWQDDSEESCERCGVDTVVVKRGAHGSVLYRAGTRTPFPPAVFPHVVDPTGAGDAFNAGLIAGLRRGHSIEDAIGLAGRVGAHVVTVAGAIDLSFEEPEPM